MWRQPPTDPGVGPVLMLRVKRWYSSGPAASAPGRRLCVADWAGVAWRHIKSQITVDSALARHASSYCCLRVKRPPLPHTHFIFPGGSDECMAGSNPPPLPPFHCIPPPPLVLAVELPPCTILPRLWRQLRGHDGRCSHMHTHTCTHARAYLRPGNTHTNHRPTQVCSSPTSASQVSLSLPISRHCKIAFL